MYNILVTVSFSQIVQSAFLFWLWFKMWREQPLMIDYVPVAHQTNAPSAPFMK